LLVYCGFPCCAVESKHASKAIHALRLPGLIRALQSRSHR
jgi:hypothetical protein